MRRFTQTFVLAAQAPTKYYVHNDIFRYQDFGYTDEEEEELEAEGNINESSERESEVENVKVEVDKDDQQNQTQQLSGKLDNVVQHSQTPQQQQQLPPMTQQQQIYYTMPPQQQVKFLDLKTISESNKFIHLNIKFTCTLRDKHILSN